MRRGIVSVVMTALLALTPVGVPVAQAEKSGRTGHVVCKLRRAPQEVAVRRREVAEGGTEAGQDGPLQAARKQVGISRALWSRPRQRRHSVRGDEVAGGLWRITDIARDLNVSRQRAQQLVRKPGFPARIAEDGVGPLWQPSDVRRWARGWRRERPWRSTDRS